MGASIQDIMKNNPFKLSILCGGLLFLAFSLPAFSQCQSVCGYDGSVSQCQSWGGGCDGVDYGDTVCRVSSCSEAPHCSDWSVPVAQFTCAGSDFDCDPSECAAKSCGEGGCSRSTGLSWVSLEMLVRELIGRLGFHFEGLSDRVDDSTSFYYSEKPPGGAM